VEQAAKVLPLTVAVLAPLTKFGTLEVAPIGAKLTVAVIADVGTATAPAAAPKNTGIVNVAGAVETVVTS